MKKSPLIIAGTISVAAIAIILIGGVILWKSQSPMANVQSNSETADWKTYKNDEYGFEVKYPDALNLYERLGRGACPTDYCVELLHETNTSYDYKFSVHISKDGQGIGAIHDSPRVVVANQSASYEENQEGSRWYRFEKDKMTYEVYIYSDQSNQDYERLREAMLTTFKFTAPENTKTKSVSQIFDSLANPCDCLINASDEKCKNVQVEKIDRSIAVFGGDWDVEAKNITDYLNSISCPLAAEGNATYYVTFSQDSVKITNNTTAAYQILNPADIGLVSWWSSGSLDLFSTTDDINFDGYKDLSVVTGEGYMGVNWFYDYYMFNPETKQFEKALTGVCNPNFNPSEKIIGSSCKSGPTYCTTVYTFNGSTYTRGKVKNEISGGEDFCN